MSFSKRVPPTLFLDCFLYLPERQTLFTLIEHHVPNFPNWTKKKKLDLLLRGIYPDNPDFTTLNTTLTKAVQNFILSTKRFSSNKQFYESPHPPPHSNKSPGLQISYPDKICKKFHCSKLHIIFFLFCC